MRLVYLLTITIATALAACAPSIATAGSTPGPTADSVHLDAQQTKALRQYQRDLVSVLALRAGARPLLGAALLARPLKDQPSGLHFHDLIQRAAAAGDASEDATWMQLGDCDHKAGTCPDHDALAALEKQAPDNAAVWIMAYTKAMHAGDDAAMRHAMHMAANAKRYDDYAGDSLQALAWAVQALPVPASVRASGRPAAVSRQIIAFGIGDAQPTPVLPTVAQHCKKGADDTDIRTQCLKLAHILVWAGSPLARSLGLHLQATLGRSGTARSQAVAARRDLTWQVSQFSKLMARAASDASVAKQMLKLARDGGTQMSIMLASLRARHVGVHAPDGWQPAGH